MTAIILSFPCRHTRQYRPDRSKLPCAYPGCSKSLPGDPARYCDRLNPPFTLTYERRVTGGGTGPLRYFWRVVAPGPGDASASERPAP